MGVLGCASITSCPRVLCPVLGSSVLAFHRRREMEKLPSPGDHPFPCMTQTEGVKTPSAQRGECAKGFCRERNCPWL